MFLKAFFLISLLIGALACADSKKSLQVRKSEYPVAKDLSKVGKYPAVTKSGAGYVYDEVLEYRVWIDHGDDDTYTAFATYEEAKEYSANTKDAEDPLVLILQEEHINEPNPDMFEHIQERRITEWRVEWLKDSLRSENPIPQYMEKLKSAKAMPAKKIL